MLIYAGHFCRTWLSIAVQRRVQVQNLDIVLFIYILTGKFKFQFKQNMPRVATNLAKINSLTFPRIPVECFAYFPDYLRQCKIMAFQIEAFITMYA
jgi:hypothetical protein